MLRELPLREQASGERKRRWFFCHDLDLVVWFDDKDHPIAFQLAYDKYRDERSITWDADKGYRHYTVDEGNPFAGKTQTPLLFADGPFDTNRIVDLFKPLSAEMPPEIATFVLRKLSDYPERRPENSS